MKKLIAFIASGFGLGFSPFASGTCGTLLGIPLVWLINTYFHLDIYGQIIAGLALTLLAIPICHVAESVYKKKDDGRIVADEYMTFPLCMIGLPVTPEYWWILLIAFITNRVCDIVKPFPARTLQRLKGGLGIVIDDFFASIYSLILNQIAFFVITTYVLR